MRTCFWTVLAWAALGATPAAAAVTSTSEVGFAVESSASIAANAAKVYTLLSQPERWWNGEHSYSGSAANLSLEARAGGCFCERIPGPGGKWGSVEHARVIYALPERQLRLSGALGPLQAEAVTGTLTFDIRPEGKTAKVTLSYVVGGYMRMGAANMAHLVDNVLAEQLAGLKRAAEAGTPQ